MEELKSTHHVRFRDLLQIVIKHFGEPRIKGSHHLFKMPWAGNPRVNLQKDGNMAKPYQVKQVLEALEKLKGVKNEKIAR